jgi:hypothetical protein
VEAAVVEGYVDVDNIPIFQDVVVRNAVADDFVDGGTYRLWEVAVIERRWV